MKKLKIGTPLGEGFLNYGKAESPEAKPRKRRAARAISAREVELIRVAIGSLKKARRDLRNAGAKQAADYVAACIKSAQGAERHAHRVMSRPQSTPMPGALAALNRHRGNGQ